MVPTLEVVVRIKEDYGNNKVLHVGRPDWVEAGGVGGEKVHPRRNKGDRRLLNTLQGTGTAGRTAKESV